MSKKSKSRANAGTTTAELQDMSMDISKMIQKQVGPVVGEFYKLGAKSGDIRELLDWNWVDINTYDGSEYLQQSVVKI